MKTLIGYKLDKHTIATLVGLAFLWPCLQASGFYPLSIVPEVGFLGSGFAAQYHMWYSLALVIVACLAIAFRKRLESFVCTSRLGLVSFGIVGSIGHIILQIISHDSVYFSALLVIAIACIAVFVAFFVVTWATRITQSDIKQAVFTVALSFILSQIILIAYYLTGLPQGYFLAACPLGGSVCIVASASELKRKGKSEISSIRSLPWSMVIPALFLIYFCVIFVRLLISGFSGDTETPSKMITVVFSALIFGVVLVILASKLELMNKLVVVFACLAIVYLVVLSVMLLAGHEETIVRRSLVASEHCFEAFLWMLLVYTIVRKNLSSVLVFGFYVICAVVIPWAISFDLFYLSDLHLVIPRDEIAVPAVTFASLVAAISTIVFLMFYAFRLGKKSAQSQEDWQKELVKHALSGALADTENSSRKIEIAVLVYRGYSAKRIAEMLYVSEPTVKSYTTQIYRTLNIHSKQEFISFIDSHRESMTDL